MSKPNLLKTVATPLIIVLTALAVLSTVPLLGYLDAPVEAGRRTNSSLTRKLEAAFKASNFTEEQKIAKLKEEIGDLDAMDAESVRSLIEVFQETLLEMKEGQQLPLVELAVLDEIAKIRDTEVLKELREDLADFEVSIRVRVRLFDSMAADTSEDGSLFIISLMTNGSASVRMLATEEMGKRLYKDGFDAVLGRVRYDAAHRVKKVAIEAATRYARKWREDCLKTVVQALIDLMVRTDLTEGGGMVVGACAEGLKELSGEDLGTDPAAWAEWWRQKEKIEAGEEVKKRTDAARTYKAYGISTMSKRVVFVVDTSSSMLKELTDKEKADMRGDEVTGKKEEGKEGVDELDWDNIKTKWDFAREELKRIVRNLDEQTRFTIISYSDNTIVWEDEIQLAEEKTKDKAIKWIDKLSTGNRTNIYGAIDDAISLAEQNVQEVGEDDKKKRRRRPRRGDDDEEEDEGEFTGESEDLVPDTIYFLTDGYATAGKYRGPEIGNRQATKDETDLYIKAMETMLAEIKDRNRIVRITINAIGIGREHDHWTLRRLADQNNGIYVSFGK